MTTFAFAFVGAVPGPAFPRGRDGCTCDSVRPSGTSGDATAPPADTPRFEPHFRTGDPHRRRRAGGRTFSGPKARMSDLRDPAVVAGFGFPAGRNVALEAGRPQCLAPEEESLS
jgi:hypothetical protein